jgi:hypothetical protein
MKELDDKKPGELHPGFTLPYALPRHDRDAGSRYGLLCVQTAFMTVKKKSRSLQRVPSVPNKSQRP